MPHDPVAQERRARIDATFTDDGTTPLATLLLEARVRKGMTRSELARAAGVHNATIWRIESGQTDQVTDDLAERIANALGVDLYEFHDAQDTIPPDLRDRVRVLTAGDMLQLRDALARG